MEITEHQVRERAYYIWEGEGRVHGRADSHWLRAEAELRVAPEAKPARKSAPRAAKVEAVKAEAAKTGITKTETKAAKPAAKTAEKTA
ncbi:DUF2934 domain-containing protein, partial [Methylobacterium dankookense]